jgi:uncharacterized cofD-like protein
VRYNGFVNKNTKICTIGGGTAMPIVNKSLVKSGFEHINSIVTTFDSGGDTGRIRTDERGRVLAFSDYWRSLISLWNDGNQKEVWEEMLRYRDGRGRNFGNIFFQFLSEKEGNLGEVDELFSKLTGAKLKGEVIPVSLELANVCQKTISGKEYKGENFVDELRMSDDRIVKIWLEPKVQANKIAIEVLKKAEVIIVGPGTTYGSVLPNFLPRGMVEAYNQSRAKKIFMVNIFSPANEVKKPSQAVYKKIFSRYLGTDFPFDMMVMADLTVLDQEKLKLAMKYYKLEHATAVNYEKYENDKVILADIAVIEEKNIRLRHSEEKLGKFFEKLEI